jgi:hypothetical protein
MTRENVQQIIDEVLYGSLNVKTVHVFTRFQVVNVEQDANGKFPAFTLSDTLLSLEFPGFPRYQWISLDGIDLITAD